MLTKTSLHDELKDFLSYHKHELPALLDYFETTPEYKDWVKLVKRGRNEKQNFSGMLSEAHLRLSLKQSPEELRTNEIQFDPILHGAKTTNLQFYNSPSGGVCCKSRHEYMMYRGRRVQKEVGEIDAVLMMDGVLTLFEIKIKDPRKTNGRRGARLCDLIKEDRVAEIVTPFREYAEEHLNTSKVAYVHMIAADQVNPEGNKGQRDFIQRNGILVPFYTDRFTFNDIDVPRANEELLRRARLAA